MTNNQARINFIRNLLQFENFSNLKRQPFEEFKLFYPLKDLVND